jgi:hypothetical protein
MTLFSACVAIALVITAASEVDPKVASFLAENKISAQCAENFAKHEIDFGLLTEMRDTNLQEIGISAWGARKKIVQALQRRNVTKQEGACHEEGSTAGNGGVLSMLMTLPGFSFFFSLLSIVWAKLVGLMGNQVTGGGITLAVAGVAGQLLLQLAYKLFAMLGKWWRELTTSAYTFTEVRDVRALRLWMQERIEARTLSDLLLKLNHHKNLNQKDNFPEPHLAYDLYPKTRAQLWITLEGRWLWLSMVAKDDQPKNSQQQGRGRGGASAQALVQDVGANMAQSIDGLFDDGSKSLGGSSDHEVSVKVVCLKGLMNR